MSRNKWASIGTSKDWKQGRKRREKENRGSLAVSIQQTDSEQIQNYIVSAKIFAGGSHFANSQLTCEKGGSLAVSIQRTDPELHPLGQNLRWRFEFRELVANM